MPRPKGLPKTGGRSKGATNKETRANAEAARRIFDIVYRKLDLTQTHRHETYQLLSEFKKEDPYSFLRGVVMFEEERRRFAGEWIKKAKCHSRKREVQWDDFRGVSNLLDEVLEWEFLYQSPPRLKAVK